MRDVDLSIAALKEALLRFFDEGLEEGSDGFDDGPSYTSIDSVGYGNGAEPVVGEGVVLRDHE